MNSVTKIDLLTEQLNLTERDVLQYALGGLMYTPAHNDKIADKLIYNYNPYLRSLAFCLEDAIADGTEEVALKQLKESFRKINTAVLEKNILPEALPYIFVRVKYPEQMKKVYDLIGDYGLLRGFIFPKFDNTNVDDYLEELVNINKLSDKEIYGMPILESGDIVSVEKRVNELVTLKSSLDDVIGNILNIRIGGNDFCNAFGVRRGIRNTIYDIRVISDIISDIVNVFARDYVVSAPVWEYFASKSDNSLLWAEGLRRELKFDILNGLMGKTAIHPTQLPVIDEALAVNKDDYNDAVSVLNWTDNLLAVSKSSSGNRMNEQKVHHNWANKILVRSAIYGIREVKYERASIKNK